MVYLRPDKLVDVDMPTVHFPKLSILSNSQWIPAPAKTSSFRPNAARIFDVAISAMPGRKRLIPLSSAQPDYSHKRYWRLPSPVFGGILGAIILHAMNNPSNIDPELHLARSLLSYLSPQRDALQADNSDSARPGGLSGPNGSVLSGPCSDRSESSHRRGRSRRSSLKKRRPGESNSNPLTNKKTRVSLGKTDSAPTADDSKQPAKSTRNVGDPLPNAPRNEIGISLMSLRHAFLLMALIIRIFW
jgi:hypothetical protein